MSLYLSTISEDLKLASPTSIDSLERLEELILAGSWSPFLFAEDRRKAANFNGSNFIVFDVDGGLSLDEALTRLDGLWQYVGTTRHHGIAKKNQPAVDRFRIVLRLDRFVSHWEDYAMIWKALRAKYAPESDSFENACKKSQLFYACQQTRRAVEGRLISVDQTLAAARKAQLASLTGKLELASSNGQAQLASLQQDQLASSNGQAQLASLQQDQLASLQQAKLASSDQLAIFKGELSRRTLKFMVHGAPDGEWNHEIFLAARDYAEQGWDETEFLEAASKITGHLDSADIKTIESAYKQEAGNELRVTEDQIEAQIDSVNLFDKLSETEDFLTNPLNTKGWSTGFPSIDHQLGGGLLPHYLTALSGKMKGGKTTFISALMYNLAQSGVKSAMMSLEMSASKHLMPSLISMAFEVNLRRAEPDDVKFIIDQTDKKAPFLKNINFYNKMGRTSGDKIKAFIEHQHLNHGVNVFFIDHFLYALKDTTDRKELSNLTKVFREITDKYPIHLMVIFQAKNIEHFNGRQRRVSRADLYGGATIGHDINNLIILERDTDQKNYTKVYLTDSHNVLAHTSDSDYTVLRYDYDTCKLTE